MTKIYPYKSENCKNVLIPRKSGWNLGIATTFWGSVANFSKEGEYKPFLGEDS